MTLDDGFFTRIIKGHFSDILISNIIGYLSFY